MLCGVAVMCMYLLNVEDCFGLQRRLRGAAMIVYCYGGV